MTVIIFILGMITGVFFKKIEDIVSIVIDGLENRISSRTPVGADDTWSENK